MISENPVRRGPELLPSDDRSALLRRHSLGRIDLPPNSTPCMQSPALEFSPYPDEHMPTTLDHEDVRQETSYQNPASSSWAAKTCLAKRSSLIFHFGLFPAERQGILPRTETGNSCYAGLQK